MCFIKCFVNWIPGNMHDSIGSIISQIVNLNLLRQGWVLFERKCVFAGIQFTKHFVEFLVEMNRFYDSNSSVILTQQSCGHRSSRVAGSKRQAQAFYFSVRILYVFLISKCRGESDLGLCMSSVLAKRMYLHIADFWRILWPNTLLTRCEDYADTPCPCNLLEGFWRRNEGGRV